MHSTNLMQGNIERIRDLFPGCVTEAKVESGELKLAVDFDQLRQELTDSVVDGPQERFQLNWPGKREALLTANAPIAKTLRPSRPESVEFDGTKNLFIEGDNLEALKLLQETYLGKVRMIYIDPPYNTGSDFVYMDDFSEDLDSYLIKSNQVGIEGERLVANTESNGRFHSDWLCMIYPRVKLARNLLGEDGIFFMSIGQEEVASALQLCNEVFGESNRVGVIGRAMKRGGNNGRFFSPNLEFILVFARNIEKAVGFKDKMSQDLIDKVYNQLQKEGKRKGEYYRTMGLYQPSLTLERSRNARYFIECPDGTKCIPPEGKRWRVIESSYLQMLDEGDIEFKETTTSPLWDESGVQSKWNVYSKIWLKDRQEEGQIPVDIILKFENRLAAKELIELEIPFDFAKPSELIKYLIEIAQIERDAVVLDFFAGSATTAHAVIERNAEDNGSRKFIMVQLPEPCDQKSEAYKAGYQSIADISKERIRRIGKKIAERAPNVENLDIGFRVLKVDTSNMADIYYSPDSLEKGSIDLFVNNIKPDRTSEDLLFQLMLDWGVDLTLPITKINIHEKEVSIVDGSALAACFDAHGGVDEGFVKELAKLQPLRVVFRDAGFKDSAVKINVEQIFKLLSPTTEVKCI
ncbi:MAG: site-specific DNA-methyltransferase [Burkholderiales bacterium]|nr:site-specific DNA-methyltransferase [Burkholderiales bacterium]